MKVITRINKIGRKILQLAFGFENWHISPLQERPYAIDIIIFCNSLAEKKCFVEIGCGLGDIIRNVKYERRVGLDMDYKVLKAAKWISGFNSPPIIYHPFTFPEDHLKEKTNVLVMVNWIHHISPNVLEDKLTEYLNNNILTGGIIIIDTVQDAAYKYNHHIDFLTKSLNCSFRRIGHYARQREVWAIKKQN